MQRVELRQTDDFRTGFTVHAYCSGMIVQRSGLPLPPLPLCTLPTSPYASPMSSLPRPRTSLPSTPSSGLISAARFTTLLVSVLVALCSGTNYVCVRVTSPRRKELTVIFRSPGLFRYDAPGTHSNRTSDQVPSSSLWAPAWCPARTVPHAAEPRWFRRERYIHPFPVPTITTHPTL